MVSILLLLFLCISILFILKKNSNKSNLYSKLILITIFLGLFFLLITSGRFIVPQLLQILKIGLPFITKFIGL